MKKTLNLIFAALFVLLCLVPSAGMLVFGQSKTGANEVLSAAPALYNKDGSFNTKVLGDTADWFADRTALRQEMITAWAKLQAGLLHSSVQEQVVLGSDGWLYYSPTLADYRGEAMADGELQTLAHNLWLLQEYCEANGMQFVFTCAPNKNSLYPEHMPAGITAGHENSSLAKLPALLAAEGVNYADLYSALQAQPKTLYYATDTHWTAKGAALGADTILAVLGRDSGYYGSGFAAGENRIGDLYEMLYPAAKTGTEAEVLPQYSFAYTTAKSTNGGNAMKIESTNPAQTGKLMCWRDSFGIALYPYLAESFGEATFSRANSYDLLTAAESGADSVVIELVERNLGYLLSYLPVFPAQACNVLAGVTAEGGAVSMTAKNGTTAATATLQEVRIALPVTAENGAVHAYVCADGVTYAAYLLKGENGLEAALWLTQAATVQSVLVAQNGVVTQYSLN